LSEQIRAKSVSFIESESAEMSRIIHLSPVVLLLTISSCSTPPHADVDSSVSQTIEQDQTVEVAGQESDQSLSPNQDTIAAGRLPGSLIAPDDLTYLGAFRLPGESGGSSWEYSGYALAFNPDGDPDGTEDGFPGSLFGIGHDHQQYVSEITIPLPVISQFKNPDDLNFAETLQPFTDITNGMYGYLEIPRAGLAILPPQSDQSESKLYFSWGQHFEDEWPATHGWIGLDLDSTEIAGPWHVGGYSNYVTNDYLFEIPGDWAVANAPGLRLATGRFRDGHWSGLGPALFAIGPWLDGNPPEQGSRLEHVTPLLLYGRQIEGNLEIAIDDVQPMNTFSEPDEWSGGAWLTAGERSAVIFVGTKAIGKSWYGFANGVVYPISGDPDEIYPEVPPWPYDSRGWWSEDISAQILFYDPNDLAAVAQGQLETWEPQPYASLVIDEYLFDPGFNHERAKRYLLGAAAFDREHGYLYVVERLADEDRSLVHVFGIE
jgi:hypothetical protein